MVPQLKPVWKADVDSRLADHRLQLKILPLCKLVRRIGAVPFSSLKSTCPLVGFWCRASQQRRQKAGKSIRLLTGQSAASTSSPAIAGSIAACAPVPLLRA